MTEREQELLASLSKLPVDGWAAPRALGATRMSWHTLALRRMVPKGWVISRERPSDPRAKGLRASLEYQMTKGGVVALANARVTRPKP